VDEAVRVVTDLAWGTSPNLTTKPNPRNAEV
jgi:hypothetical protein